MLPLILFIDRLTPQEKLLRLFLYVEMAKMDDLEALLISNGNLINMADEQGRTALHKVIISNTHIHVT